jgi:hypothetical protein
VRPSGVLEQEKRARNVAEQREDRTRQERVERLVEQRREGSDGVLQACDGRGLLGSGGDDRLGPLATGSA